MPVVNYGDNFCGVTCLKCTQEYERLSAAIHCAWSDCPLRQHAGGAMTRLAASANLSLRWYLRRVDTLALTQLSTVYST